MPVKHQIGAGGRIYMADATAPETVAATSTYDRTKFITGMNINQTIATDNVTTLDADLDNFAERFIAALNNSSGNMNVLYDAPTGAFLRVLDAIKNGNLHSLGRGKTNFIYDPYGTVPGNLRFTFTVILTSIPLSGELGRAVGGQVGIQVDGQVTLASVP
jgi:hypothetical protein